MSQLVIGIVLAGGASRRMGRDKRAIEIGGASMLATAIELVARVSDEVIVSCRRDDPPEPVVLGDGPPRVVFDERDGGPLAGIEAAMRAATFDLAVVVPVDMPALAPAMLDALIEAAAARTEVHGAVYAGISGVAPFPGAYRRSILPALAAQLDAGAFRVHDLLRLLDLVEVVPSPAARTGAALATNVNTPADLALATGEDPK